MCPESFSGFISQTAFCSGSRASGFYKQAVTSKSRNMKWLVINILLSFVVQDSGSTHTLAHTHRTQARGAVA